MAIGDVHQVAIHCEQEGQKIVNVFHVRAKTAVGTLQTACDQIIARWAQHVRSHQISGFAYRSVKGRSLIPFGAQYEAASVLTGTFSGDNGIPTPMAGLVQWNTNQAGRRRRGRTFVGGTPLIRTSGSQFTSAGRSSLQTGIDNFLVEFKSGGTDPNWEVGVWSRVLAGPLPPYSPAAFAVIFTATVKPVLAVQRRRKMGTGL